jgi:cellobiose phosphorylase
LAEFLVGLLADWAEIYRRLARETAPKDDGWAQRAADFDRRKAALTTAINEHSWDGAWYIRATLDDGTRLGSRESRVARIFLNTQTWAILNDVAPPERAAQCLAAMQEHLLSDAGPLLLSPAFDVPVREIGYITRYAPGMRENGGIYTHAATWALAAACKLRAAELVGRLLTAINPALHDSDRYWAEPYVLPGNVDGPNSPHAGRAGWTWYTGSAQWLHRVMTQWVLGVLPEWDGLRIDPCLPPGWKRAAMLRPYRGSTYQIQIERTTALPPGVRAEVTLDGTRLPHPCIAPDDVPGRKHDVHVRCR